VAKLTWRHTRALTNYNKERISRSEPAAIRDPIQRQARIPESPFYAIQFRACKPLLQGMAEEFPHVPTELPRFHLELFRQFADSWWRFATEAFFEVGIDPPVQIRATDFPDRRQDELLPIK
jgi:hypothetical protein